MPAWSKDYSQTLEPIVTSKVDLNGTRHDNTRTDCFDAPAGELIKQVSVKSQMLIDRDQANLFGGVPEALILANPISADLDAMRPSVLPGLLAG